MVVIRDATTVQIGKLESSVAVEEMKLRSVSCDGECWDCDNCGGSQTH